MTDTAAAPAPAPLLRCWECGRVGSEDCNKKLCKFCCEGPEDGCTVTEHTGQVGLKRCVSCGRVRKADCTRKLCPGCCEETCTAENPHERVAIEKEAEEKAAKEFVKLMASDGKQLEVRKNVVWRLQTVKAALEDNDGEGDEDEDNVVPISAVDGETLEQVVKFYEYHLVEAVFTSKEDKGKWDDKFLDLDQPTLFRLILAANFLNCEQLLDAACAKLASHLRGKSIEEMRTYLNVVNDLTPEEEEEVRKDTAWCDDVTR